jgi:hypothetical protein
LEGACRIATFEAIVHIDYNFLRILDIGRRRVVLTHVGL